MLWYLRHGGLPWIGQTLTARQLAEEKKRFCQDASNTPPIHFHHFLKRARALRREERPDYGSMKELFSRLMSEKGLDSAAYDWAAEIVT